MAKNIFLQGTPVLILALMLAVVGCKQDGGGGGDDPDPFLGETVTISGEQVYTSDNEGKLSEFTGDLKLKEDSGASGEIKGGKLTLTLVAPTTGLEVIDDDFGENFDGMWTEVTINPTGVKGLMLEGFEITDSDKYKVVYRGNVSETSKSITQEIVYYMYVDNDVKITGKGATETDEDGTYKIDNLNLSLKKGWNTVYSKMSETDTTLTASVSLRNPKNLKWVLGESD